MLCVILMLNFYVHSSFRVLIFGIGVNILRERRILIISLVACCKFHASTDYSASYQVNITLPQLRYFSTC